MGGEQGTAAERSHLRRSATGGGVIQSTVVQPFTPSARAVTAVPTVGGQTPMFEFHGWASIRYHTHDTDSVLQDQCWSRLVEHVDSIPNDLVQLQRYNGCDSLHIAGQHNHRSDYVIELFRWVAANARGSYGVLYVWDDEDQHRGEDYSNVFRVWRLARSELTESDDPFLSPAIPTVEAPYDESRGD